MILDSPTAFDSSLPFDGVVIAAGRPTLGFNGLTIADGTSIILVDIAGLEDHPDVQSADTQRPRTDGLLGGLDLLGGRTITLTLGLLGDTSTSVAELIDQAKAAFAPIRDPSGALPLTFEWAGISQRLVYARPRKLASTRSGDLALGSATVAVQLVCDDPLIYDASAQVLSTGLPTPASGMAFPATFPLTFGGTVGGGGIIIATNGGDWPAPWVATITGLCTNPRIQNVTTGESISLGITVAAGDTLELDSDARTVTLNGTGDRYSAVVPASAWFSIQPGDNQIGFFSADASPTGATLTVTFSSARL